MMARNATMHESANSLGPGPGERRLRQRRRNHFGYLALCLALGGVLGGVMGAFDSGPNHSVLIDFTRLALPPAIAVVIAIAFILSLVVLPLYMFRKIDELKVLQNMQALSGGAFAVLGGYPAWQLLAAGGLAPQPSAWGVFLLGYGFMLVSFVALRLRG